MTLEDNISGDGGEDGDDLDAKQEYVKKEYVARPYASDTGGPALSSHSGCSSRDRGEYRKKYKA